MSVERITIRNGETVTVMDQEIPLMRVESIGADVRVLEITHKSGEGAIEVRMIVTANARKKARLNKAMAEAER